MQVWPEELEPLVKNLRVVNTHVPVDLNTLCRGLCNVLDIPVYEDLLESLHWMFMLYLELKNSQQQIDEPMMMGRNSGVNFANFA
jgi:intraflagellar transport protein 46